MIVLFKTAKLEKELSTEKLMTRAHGPRRAALIKRRLAELAAADVLDHMRFLPQARCHELKGDLKGKLSVDLDHPCRLIFEPADSPVPRKEDGGLDWSKVKSIRILSSEDTHE